MHIDFSLSERTSLDVERGLELVDFDTRQLTGASDAVLSAMSTDGAGEHPKAKHEHQNDGLDAEMRDRIAL